MGELTPKIARNGPLFGSLSHRFHGLSINFFADRQNRVDARPSQRPDSSTKIALKEIRHVRGILFPISKKYLLLKSTFRFAVAPSNPRFLNPPHRFIHRRRQAAHCQPGELRFGAWLRTGK